MDKQVVDCTIIRVPSQLSESRLHRILNEATKAAIEMISQKHTMRVVQGNDFIGTICTNFQKRIKDDVSGYSFHVKITARDNISFGVSLIIDPKVNPESACKLRWKNSRTQSLKELLFELREYYSDQPLTVTA